MQEFMDGIEDMVNRLVQTYHSISSPISSDPALSIADNRLSSVKCFGGCVKCSDTFVCTPSKTMRLLTFPLCQKEK